MEKKKHPVLKFFAVIIVLAVFAGIVFIYFGGFGTGKSADTEAFAKYAGEVSEIEIPDQTRIVAFGEASHGNREFQQLRLDVFKLSVEKYGVRALALEGDFGGCEAVNRYIHGAEGTAEDAAAAIGFALYRTDEMADLISWIREYNETAPEGQDLRFYGFDMQRYEYNYQYLLEEAKAFGLDTADLEKLRDGDDLSDSFSNEEREAVYKDIRQKLLEESAEAGSDRSPAFAVHLADILIQNIEMGNIYENNASDANGVRDMYMAENTMWILQQEELRGNRMIFAAGHNGHIEQTGCYDEEHKVMGNLLTDEIGDDAYFAIGTDFYRTKCNLPKRSGGRAVRTFYSHDPLAKAAKKNGYDISWLNFSKVPEGCPLVTWLNDSSIYMGSLGEVNADGINGIILRILPFSYRIYRVPSEMYDGMIFVTNAHPTEIRKQ